MSDTPTLVKSKRIKTVSNFTGGSSLMTSQDPKSSVEFSITSTVVPTDWAKSSGEVYISVAPLESFTDLRKSKQRFLFTPILLSHMSRDDVFCYHFRDRDIDQPFFAKYDTRIHNLILKDTGEFFNEAVLGFEFGVIYGCYILFADPANIPAPEDEAEGADDDSATETMNDSSST